MAKSYYKKSKNCLMISCIHILTGRPVYYQTGGTVLCEKYFKYYDSFGQDKNGYWKIPKNEDISNLKTVCRSCINQIIKNNDKILC